MEYLPSRNEMCNSPVASKLLNPSSSEASDVLFVFKAYYSTGRKEGQANRAQWRRIPGESDRSIANIAFIGSPQSGCRVLLTFGIGGDIMDSEIEYAKLVIPYSLVSEDMELELHRISIPWDSGTVSWSFPWNSAGGDYMALPQGTLRLHSEQPEGKDHFIDVTEHLREIQGGEENHGFLIMPTVEYGEGFGQGVVNLLENAGSLAVKLYLAGNN